ncbi:MAG TPA: hypothetical protein VGM88_03500 [Kofleriaceae bacterium]|jgi:hypothetical protein
MGQFGEFMQRAPQSPIERIEALLAEWFRARVKIRVAADLIHARVAGTSLAIAQVARPDARNLGIAFSRLAPTSKAIEVVAVPFMTDAGARMCAEQGMSWLDLSGNADIRGPGMRIRIRGEANRYVRRGRPSTPFAPKSSRVVRWLLLHPRATYTQIEIAAQTQVDRAQISRIVARLAEDELLRVGSDGRVGIADRKRLLAAWSAAYRFDQHHIVRAHVPSRTGTATEAVLSTMLSAEGIRHAFTGLAAAWAYSQFANFRLVTVYVDRLPVTERLTAADIVEQEAGANIWFVVPKDAGVFDGAKIVAARVLAHPVQVWLDLAAQPERAADAATELYRRIARGELDA